MNIEDLHDPRKEVSAKAILGLSNASVTALHLAEKSVLKEHISKIPALLFCIHGEALYYDENNKEVILKSGDYLPIEPMVQHGLKGITACNLLLVK